MIRGVARVTLGVVRRLLTSLALIATLATACAAQVQTELTAADVAEGVDAASATSRPSDDVATPEIGQEVEAAETPTTTEPPDELRTGREAILANHTEGKPYVLFYWGAH